ncbi:hypothetical protein VKT23_001996 [Stygiomarasmius scandens]|uniref:Uncharacterized protein n=1 Tax=Marasmiellus scandens TaxID=2682957 RepID=A0ABR1K210_9AGAR
MDPATKFHTALPFSLYSVSPALSALHVTRIRRESPETPLDACARCGTLLRHGSSTRIARGTHRKRCLQSKCNACGWMNEQPIAAGNESLFSKRNPNAPVQHQISAPSREVVISRVEKVQTVPDIKSPVIPNPGPKSKPRPKKKAGLQEMLARNRLKEEKEKQTNQKSSGLAAFLDGL